MNNINQEVYESQKVRSDLLKWKIILIAGTGATALGFNKNFQNTDSHLLLCFIPFVCIYVDILCRHLSIRIQVIGNFLKSYTNSKKKDRLIEYEKFANYMSEKNIFSFESFALKMSTVLVSFLILPIGFIIELKQNNNSLSGIQMLPVALLLLSGIFGIVGSAVLNRTYKKKQHFIREEAKRIANSGLKERV